MCGVDLAEPWTLWRVATGGHEVACGSISVEASMGSPLPGSLSVGYKL